MPCLSVLLFKQLKMDKRMETKTRLLVLVMLTAFILQSFAQKPEPVFSVVRQVQDFEWYEQQAKAWKQEIDGGTKDNMAWVYWYEANRMACDFCDSEKFESKMGDYFVTKTQIIELAEKAIPNSFELNILKMKYDKTGSGSSDAFLFKAHSIKPYDNLLLPNLLNYYQIKNDKPNVELTCKKWFDSNEIPQELLITAYNNLVSLDSNAILLTYGDNDTYPCWVLQNAQKFRPDVLVLNIPMATFIDEYREKTFEKQGIKPIIFEKDSIRDDKALFKHLIKNVPNRPIYVSAFTSEEVYKAYGDKMYFVGLSLKYSPKPFDNMAVLRNNIENKYMLDFLKRNFYNNYAQSVVNTMSAGYLASFQKLYGYYKQAGKNDQAQKIRTLAVIVAENTGKTEWLNYFGK